MTVFGELGVVDTEEDADPVPEEEDCEAAPSPWPSPADAKMNPTIATMATPPMT